MGHEGNLKEMAHAVFTTFTEESKGTRRGKNKYADMGSGFPPLSKDMNTIG